GVRLDVTPRITPDGRVIMHVLPEISSVSPTQVNLGNGVLATAFNEEQVETTVVAADGETVVIGGLIEKDNTKSENKIPWLGDLPGIGACFRYRTQSKTKREVLVILTPHIVRSRLDADRILAEEARRMDWILGDVIKMHGTSGMEPVFPQPQPGGGGCGRARVRPVVPGSVPAGPLPVGPGLGDPNAAPETPASPPAQPEQQPGAPTQTPATGKVPVPTGVVPAKAT